MTAVSTGAKHRAEDPWDDDDDDDDDDLDPYPVARPRAADLPKPPVPGSVTVIVRALMSLAVLSGWLVVYALGVSAVQQARTQEQLYNEFREKLSLATVPIGGEIELGTPVALIEAPSIGLRQVVVEGTTSGVMRDGPGHRRDTPLPGQPGTSVVYGHSAAFGGPFRSITDLQTGDKITATSGLGIFEYEVMGVRRAKDPLPVPVQKGGGRLTLVTAEADGWRHGWAPTETVYIDAKLNGDSQLGWPGRPTSVPVAEKAMQADPDALVPLVFWLQAFLAAALATTWARVRWGGLQSWFVGLPVLFACLWGTVETLAQFLPNLV